MKTSELTGDDLDWAVAKCEGPNSVAACYYDDDGLPIYLEEADRHVWEPSTDWAQGGPIIERENISVWETCTEVEDPQEWMAITSRRTWGEDGERDASCGPTPLIAAMRCFVASRLGDEVEIPKELT